ncbi:hypothetical protein OC842_000648 [Tilletia horrida]|uniref:Uncharacterized protein n=1 Tax=Tilletia horrida TaxID=155126 RepID=A0AAN6GGD3_9BASI|nr:hypothetical protein OC842_000648 [Tilletia horrida]
MSSRREGLSGPALAGILATLAATSLALLSSPVLVLAAPTSHSHHDAAARQEAEARHADGRLRPAKRSHLQHLLAARLEPSHPLLQELELERRQNNGGGTGTAVPTQSQNPGDPNSRPGTALSVFRRQATTVFTNPTGVVTSTSPSSTNGGSGSNTGGGGGGGGGGNNLLNDANLPAPFLAFAVAAIALFVLVVAFVLLRIFVRNRRLRRLGLLPGDLSGSRIVGPAREIEDTLVPPKLWEAKIADLEEVQKLKAARASPNEKVQDWDGIMPIAAAFPTHLYVSLVPDGSKAEDILNGATAPMTETGGNQPAAEGGARSAARRGLGRFLRKSEGVTTDSNLWSATGSDPLNHPQGGPGNGGPASDEAALAARNDVPMPAAVNVTVLIAMPSPKTVVPSVKLPKSKKSMVSFVSAASVSKPSLIPAQLSTTKVDEVDEEYTLDDKGKTRRAPSVRSVRTAASATSFAEARREAFFKSEAGHDDGDGEGDAMPTADQRSEYGYDREDDEEEELPELMFGTASVPMYRDWAATAADPFYSSSSATRTAGPSSAATTTAPPVPVPEDLIIPTRGDLLRLLATARQVKERKKLVAATAALEEAKTSLGEDGAEGEGEGEGEVEGHHHPLEALQHAPGLHNAGEVALEMGGERRERGAGAGASSTGAV